MLGKLKAKFEKIKAKIIKYRFLFSELVKRDFKEKYKRTVLGMGWSLLSPILQLFVMRLVFTQFFGRDTPFYTTYLFAGLIVFNFYREATNNGMQALVGNARVISKINVPKYLFVLSKNVSCTINFGLTIIVFLVFAAIDGVTFGWHYFALIYPSICLIIMNIGVGFILSAMYVYFSDTKYMYSIFVLLLRYLSAVFYRVDKYPENVQRIFLLNPVYDIIKYFRVVVIDGHLPSLAFHLLVLGYSLVIFAIGCIIYKTKNHDFIYYL